jgi:hypothetical protein
MAARSRNGVRMMTRTITTHPKVNWKELESGKLWRKKKKDWSLASSGKKKHLHIYTHIHIGRYIQVITLGRRPRV